jgi:glycosyltransferase involved in cell wall biosynthesis
MTARSTRRKVLVLSLLPLRTLGGGETFTLNVARAVLAYGDDVVLAQPVAEFPVQSAHRARMGVEFITARPGATHDAAWAVERVTAAQLLDQCWSFDYVAVQQFLASDFIFDVIAALESAQTLVFTSHGYEPLLDTFARFYQPCPNHAVISVSQFAAERLINHGIPSRHVYGGVWTRDISEAVAEPRAHAQYCAVGRLLPHKGYEVAIDALRGDEELLHIGQSADAPDTYRRHLERIATGKRVRWLGTMEEHGKRRILSQSCALLACSRDVLYDGVRLEQSELLGLVILEALAAGVLPIASDVPAFQELMTRLSLADWIYPAGDSAALRERLDQLAAHGDAVRRRHVCTAQAILRDLFTWDGYWGRVRDTCEGGRS